jgi:hypothetical protein
MIGVPNQLVWCPILDLTIGETPSPVSPRLMKTPRRATLPQGGEGSKINSPLAPLGERGRGVRGCLQHTVVKYYA